MFTIDDNAKVMFYSKPTNLLKSIDGLTQVVLSEWGMDVEPHTYFLFCNFKKNRFKVLYTDGTHLAIWFKRFNGTLTFSFSNEMITFDKDGFFAFLQKTRSKQLRRRNKV